jgi:hypothetical protein
VSAIQNRTSEAAGPLSTLSFRCRERTAAGRCLEALIDEYIARLSAATTANRPPLPHWRGNTGVLTERRMNRVDAYRLIRLAVGAQT